MSPEDILIFVNRRPFEPFRLFVTDGSVYEIRHPEMVMMGKRSLAVGLAQTNAQPPLYDRLAIVALLHVTRVEPIEVSPNA